MAQDTRKGLIFYTFRRNKTSVVGLVMAVIIVCLAILAPWISPYDPIEQDIKIQYSAPSLNLDEYLIPTSMDMEEMSSLEYSGGDRCR